MMKRLFDILFSFFGLLITSPILLFFITAVWLQDLKSPFYIAPRVGKGMRIFQIVKIRSMIINADESGVDSTASNDLRITQIGRLIRRYKIDELSQLWNVLCGDMSIVGPRPNVKREVDIYTDEERHLLNFRPGITDPASIVFSDEGDILADSDDPNLEYNQVIRPWKSRLALLYVDTQSFFIDIYLIIVTCVSIISRRIALNMIHKLLVKLNADERLISVAGRHEQLYPFPPPGADSIVIDRSLAKK